MEWNYYGATTTSAGLKARNVKAWAEASLRAQAQVSTTIP
jgi:hypothetical protein